MKSFLKVFVIWLNLAESHQNGHPVEKSKKVFIEHALCQKYKFHNLKNKFTLGVSPYLSWY